MVNLDIDIPLGLAGDKKLQRELAAKLDALVAELGDEALATGRWNNGLGQVGLYVTPAGLAKLAQSAHARDFGRDDTASLRGFAYDIDGRLDRVEAEIERNGHADVEIALNLENFDYDIGPGGKALFRASAAQDAEAAAKLPALLNSLPARSVALSAPTRAAGQAETGPTRTLRIDKEGFYALKEHKGIRSFKLAGETESVAPYLDLAALDHARQHGVARVIVDLHRVPGYTPMLDSLPQRAKQAQTDTVRRVFAEIAAEFGDGMRLETAFPGYATAVFHISAQALESLYRNPDPRLRGAYLDQGGIKSALSQSTVQMNLPAAWDRNPPYIGSGQSIAIIDSGVEASHPFFGGRIIYEACFGTDSPPNDPNPRFISYCPSKNSAGDSQLGLSGSASPTHCIEQTGSTPACSHGTHVAGIAAGKRNWQYPGLPNDPYYKLSGVAHGANLIAVNIMSYDSLDTTDHLGATVADLDAALDAINASGATELTVNMSIGRNVYNTNCGSNSVEGYLHTREVVSALIGKRVPVVAATGNGTNGNPGSRMGIGYPACIEKVIKVASANYNTNTVSSFAHVANPCNYGGCAAPDPFFLAPGESITSAYTGNGADTQSGTSQAAPHVSGLYALIKAAVPGISVGDATGWIIKYGSVDVPVTVYHETNTSIKRVKVPNNP